MYIYTYTIISNSNMCITVMLIHIIILLLMIITILIIIIIILEEGQDHRDLAVEVVGLPDRVCNSNVIICVYIYIYYDSNAYYTYYVHIIQ